MMFGHVDRCFAHLVLATLLSSFMLVLASVGFGCGGIIPPGGGGIIPPGGGGGIILASAGGSYSKN